MTKKFVPRSIFMNKLVAPPEWAVDKLVPETGITCLLGKPGSYKTFGAIGIVCCKASGLEFCGRRVGPPCKTLYIAADSPQGVELRIQGWIKAHRGILEEMGLLDKDQPDLPFPNLLLLEKAVNLYKPPEVDEAIEDITELGIHAEVLVVDTLFHSSVGADLKLPEQLLPLLEQLRRLMEAVGAKTCVLVHHTTKDRDEFYGSISGIATVAAIIRFDRENETAATVTCVRMREGAPFDPFEIILTKQTVKTLPDKRGRAQFEVLVTTASAPAAEKINKKLASDLEKMEVAILARNWKKATYSTWCKVACEYSVERHLTGKILNKPWSEDKFGRLLKKLIEQGRVRKTDGSQGAEYEILFTERAKKARKGIFTTETDTIVTTSSKMNEGGSDEKEPVETTRTRIPLVGDAGSAGGFNYLQAPAKHPQNKDAGGSLEGSNAPDQVAETSVLDEALGQLNAETTKH
jgi:hypothetical protein